MNRISILRNKCGKCLFLHECGNGYVSHALWKIFCLPSAGKVRLAPFLVKWGSSSNTCNTFFRSIIIHCSFFFKKSLECGKFLSALSGYYLSNFPGSNRKFSAHAKKNFLIDSREWGKFFSALQRIFLRIVKLIWKTVIFCTEIGGERHTFHAWVKQNKITNKYWDEWLASHFIV